MKRLLGSLVLVVALAAPLACGDKSDDRADDTATPDQTDGAAEVVAIVGGSAAGGDVARSITILDSDQAVRRYVRQFRSPAFAADLADALAAHPPEDGRVLGAVVMEVSCDIPPSATVAEVDGRYVVTPGKVPSPHPECVAAVTSVAVVDLPAAAG
jgi:hypothetical protein